MWARPPVDVGKVELESIFAYALGAARRRVEAVDLCSEGARTPRDAHPGNTQCVE